MAININTSTQYQGVVETVYTQSDSIQDQRVSNTRYSNHNLVISVCGQSNADGRGANNTSNETPHPSVFMLDKGEVYRVATEPLGAQVAGWVNNIPAGLNPGTPGHSPGLAFAKGLANGAGIASCLVPCAIGSTTIAQWMPGSDDEDLTTLFGAMNVRTAKVASLSAPVFLWLGHEASGAGITESLTTGVQGNEYTLAWYNLYNAIVTRFPNAIFMYAQVATDDTSATATLNRKIGESQRRCETTYGDSTTAIGQYSKATSIPNDCTLYTVQNSDATNNVTRTATTATMVGDGGTALGFTLGTLTAGKLYRITATVTGTGNFKLLATAQKAANLAAGALSQTFTADGTATLQIVRNAGAAATNLVFSNIVVEEAITPMRANSFMVVSHDLPRNANPDDIHLSQAGQKAFGARAALAYRYFVLGQNVNGKGPRLLTTNPVTKSGTTITVKMDKAVVTWLTGETGWSYTGDVASNSNFRVYYDGVEKTITAAGLKSGDATMIELTVPTVSGVVVVTYGDRVGPGDGTSYRKGVVYDSDSMPLPMFGPIIAV